MVMTEIQEYDPYVWYIDKSWNGMPEPAKLNCMISFHNSAGSSIQVYLSIQIPMSLKDLNYS